MEHDLRLSARYRQLSDGGSGDGPAWPVREKRRRPALPFAAAVAACLALGFSFATTESSAGEPQCAARPEAGTWTVKRPQNKQVSRLEIAIDCSNGYYLARAYVRCGRTDCSWGYAQAYPADDGMEMAFETFSAVYSVTAQFAGAAGLNVEVFTDYRSPGKPSERLRYVLERD